MAKFRGIVKGKGDTTATRLGNRGIEVTAQSQEVDLRVYLEERDGSIWCSIVIFAHDGGYSPGKYLFNGKADTLLNTPHSLLEHMMFEHAQKMLMAA